MSTITIVLSFKYKRHIASMTPSIKYPHQLSFINQMSSFSENAALGYLKAQVFTKSNPAGDNELTGSGVCRLQQAANISTLSKGRASWLFQLYATGREIFHHQSQSNWFGSCLDHWPWHQVFWNSGCQLVALNFQTPDLPMQLNQVLKSSSLWWGRWWWLFSPGQVWVQWGMRIPSQAGVHVQVGFADETFIIKNAVLM